MERLNPDARVVVIAGSTSDQDLVEHGLKVLEEAGIPYEFRILSAHRDPDALHTYVRSLKQRPVKVIIAVAGLAAALPGVCASLTDLPVLGVPVDAGPLRGVDALLSMVQMPRGIPVGTLGIGRSGMVNAAHLAIRILRQATS